MKKEKRSGFTLVEMLLATIVAAVVVVVAFGAYRTVFNCRGELDHYCQVMAHGRYALNYIRNDMANFYRNSDPKKMRLAQTKKTTSHASDSLVMYVVDDDKKYNDNTGHGDVYEVKYRVEENEQGDQRYIVRQCRPVMGANKNEHKQPVIMAYYVDELRFEFYDNQQWLRQWEHTEKIPQLVRVTEKMLDPKSDRLAVSISQEIALQPGTLTNMEAKSEK